MLDGSVVGLLDGLGGVENGRRFGTGRRRSSAVEYRG